MTRQDFCNLVLYQSAQSLTVMPGLDPGIHALDASNCRVDCRVKPGNDDLQESTSRA